VTCPQGCCPTYREHLLSISVSASAMPTRKPDQHGHERRDTKIAKDNDAYKRMRMNGMQPTTPDHAAEMEARATTKYEVESGQLFEPKLAKKLQAAQDEIVLSKGEYV
jgi:hypothetical protein